MMEDMLVTVDWNARNLQVHNGHDGKLITSHRLEYRPYDVCLISKNEVAVCLGNGTVVILSLKSIDDVKLVRTLKTGFYYCYSLAKWKSDKLIVSGWKDGRMLCWGILSITDGRMDSTHDICKGSWTHMAVKDNNLYISCRTSDSINNGVHVYDILKPKTKKFLYQHQELKEPGSIMADRDYVYVCDSNRIHQLTDSGQLVTIHTVSSSLYGIFYDDQQRLLYTTSYRSNVITIYKMESLHQPGTGIPVEILNMDDRSIQLFENALKDGKVKVYSIRVMVVGHQGVGKTTLIKRLLGEDVDMSKTDSTEGIDVHLHCCDVSLSSHEWTFRKEELEQDYRLQQLATVIIEKQQVRSEVADAKHVVIPHEGEITDISAQDHVAEEPNLVSPHPELVKTSQQVGSPVVLKNLPTSNTETMVRSESGANVSSESRMKDLNKEMLQLLQKNADKIKHDLGKYAPLNIWDFAGQYAFYTTHQMFLSKRAIYLLVSNISKHLDDMVDDECCIDKEGKMKCTVRELLSVWMNSVHSCAPPDNESKKVIPPPIILVGTHADAIEQDNRHEICENYFGEIRSHLHDKPSRYHLVEEDFAINNKVVDRKLEGLKKKIVEVASQQPYWGEEIPASWLPLEQVLMNLRAQGHKVINRSLLENKNQAGGVQISTEQLDLFLRFQHEIGTILYFSKELLKGKIVLVPQWMIKALKSLITAKMFVLRRAPSVTKLWYDFENDGKLYPELIDALWTKDKNADLHDNKDHILLLMEELNIIAKPKLNIDDASEIKEVNYFFAPCMVHEKPPREVIFPEPHEQMESSSVMCYVFTGKFLPAPIFHRLLAACVAQWPLATEKKETTDKNQIFCGCGVFQIDDYHKMTLHFSGYIIFMRVTRQGIKDKTPSSKLCIKVKEFIAKVLKKLIGYLGHNLSFEEFIQCPEYSGESVNSLIPVSQLKKSAEVRCDFHRNIIESNEFLKFWFEDQVKNTDGQFKDDVDAPITQDHINYAHLCNALITVCANALRDILLTKVPMPHKDIYKAILANKAKLNRLNKEQVKLVFPDPQGLSTGKGQTVMEGIEEGKESKVSEKGEDASMDRVLSTSIMKGVPCSDPKLLCQLLQKSQQAAFSSQSTLEANCLSVGLVLHGETPANGNCFFEAVSSQLWRLNCVVQKSPEQLRQEVVAFMKTNRVIQASEGTINLDSFIYTESFDVYCSRMARDGEWADHVVVVAMARMLKIDIMIVTSSPLSGPEDIVWVVGQTAFQGDPILLGHIWESHYMSLQPIGILVGILEPGSTAANVIQTTTTGSTAANVIQTPTSGSTAANVIQTTISGSTAANVIQTPTSGSTAANVIQTTISGSTAANVIQTPTSGSTAANVIQTPTSGSTAANVIQTPTSGSTAANVIQTTTSGSTAANVIQTPTSGSTATNVIQTTISGSTAANVIQTTISGSTAANVIQTPTSGSTAANVIQTPTSGSTAANVIQTPTSGSTAANVIQTTISGSTAANVIQTTISGSTAANVIQTPTSGSTAANVIQTPTSGSTAAHILQSTTSGSKSSTTAGLTPVLVPVLSSYYTTCGLQPQASSSIQSTTADVTQVPSLDDTGRFVHIACLLVNAGSKVLRRLLLYHTVTPTCTLDQYLAMKRIDIDKLKKNKILNKSQMDILFPSGRSTNLSDYDITLLSALFTNIVLNKSHQDLNKIQFLRDKRNEIFAHAKSLMVNSNDYQTFWNDIRRTLEALSKQCNDPDFENEISREIQGIQVSTVQGTSLPDALQTHRKIETLERLVQYLMSSHAQELNKESDDSDS